MTAITGEVTLTNADAGKVSEETQTETTAFGVGKNVAPEYKFNCCYDLMGKIWVTLFD